MLFRSLQPDMIIRHARLELEYKGEYIALLEMRKHVAWYTAGYPNSSRLRTRINEMDSMDDLYRLLEEYEKSNCEN